jgi:ankyrin repeat protein
VILNEWYIGHTKNRTMKRYVKLFESFDHSNIKVDLESVSLHWAASTDRVDVATFLIFEKGADVNEIDGDGLAPLHNAAMNGSTGVARVLIEAGADPNILDDDGMTPLAMSVIEGHVDTSKLLIEAGADPMAAFGSLQEMSAFFAGDIGWAPEGAMQRMEKRDRSKRLFGRG